MRAAKGYPTTAIAATRTHVPTYCPSDQQNSPVSVKAQQWMQGHTSHKSRQAKPLTDVSSQTPVHCGSVSHDGRVTPSADERPALSNRSSCHAWPSNGDPAACARTSYRQTIFTEPVYECRTQQYLQAVHLRSQHERECHFVLLKQRPDHSGVQHG